MMSRRTRLAALGAATLVLLATGTVFATRQPQPQAAPAGLHDETETAPTGEELAHAADRLRANEIAVDDVVFADLAGRYGVGGAVRITAWASDPTDEVTIESITAMRDGDGSDGSGMGWGQIAKDLDVHPGIGSIMGNGGGHGRDNAPGQQNRGSDEADEPGG